MEIGYDRIREYLTALKDAGDFTYEDIANLSGIPHQTVRNIYTGKTPDPRFGTVAKIIISLGGDLNEIVGYEKKREIEVNSTVSLKETYEMRIADLVRSYEERLADIKAFSDQRVADVQKCYEMRLDDAKKMYEERLAEQKALLVK
jgi:transcriptional regulator with XRE-family HTH domain